MIRWVWCAPMSMTLTVIALDLGRFRAAQGSRDADLLHRVLAKKRDTLDDHDRYFRDRLQLRPYTPLATAMEQIVNGEVDTHLRPLFQFEHAAAILAGVLGEALDADWFAEVRSGFLAAVDAVVRVAGPAWPALRDVLCRGPLLDVPLDPAMPLGTGYLTADEVQVAAAAAERIDLDELAGSDVAAEAAAQYRDWLREARGIEQDLFFHC